MSHSNPEQLSKSEISNFPGKIGRTDYSQWIKVCPRCFKPNIQPLTNISGTIIQEQWYCPGCDYAGIVIEVKTEDLIQFHLQQLARLYNKNVKTKISIS